MMENRRRDGVCKREREDYQNAWQGAGWVKVRGLGEMGWRSWNLYISLGPKRSIESNPD
jgi:hypothetical protein